MQTKCCVLNCSRRGDVDTKHRFFRFPALITKPRELAKLSKERRDAWLNAIKRKDLTESTLKFTAICSEHFVTGAPARLKDTQDKDWVPTLKMGTNSNRREKKITPSPDNQLIKSKQHQSVENLSEVEILKMKIKSQNELIKSYKNERQQFRNDQRKIVSNYEEKLKEKDVGIVKLIRQQSNANVIPIRNRSQQKSNDATIRTGRMRRNSILKYTKPCVVRLRRIPKIKEEPEEYSPGSRQSARFATLKHPNITKAKSKEQIFKEPPTNRSVNTSRQPVLLKKPSNEQTLVNQKPKDILQQQQKRTQSPLVKKNKEPQPIAQSPLVKKIKEVQQTTQSSLAKKIKENQQVVSTPSAKKINETHLKTPSIKETPEDMASTRTRRAPKPNPRYSNADLITPHFTPKPHHKERPILVLNQAEMDNSDSAEEFFYSKDKTDDNESFDETFEVESSDYSENEDLYPSKLRRKPKPSPPKPNQIKPKPTQTPSVPVKTFESKKFPQTQSLQRALTQQLQQARKRKLEEVLDDSSELIIERNKRMNIALYDANVKPKTPLRSATLKPISAAINKMQTLAPQSVLTQRRLMQGIQAIRSSTPVQKNIQKPKETQKPTEVLKPRDIPHREKPREIQKVKEPLNPICEPQKINDGHKEHRSSPRNHLSPSFVSNISETIDLASTQDDFETMPTFTIVNIHDIINKKGDSLIPKRSEDVKEISSTSPSPNSPNSPNRTTNRRKTGHTTILSEKIEATKLVNSPLRTTFPSKKPTSIVLNSTPSSRADSKLLSRVVLTPPEKRELQKKKMVEEKKLSVEKKVVEKPAPPRILNSVVGKKTLPVQPILSKIEGGIEKNQIQNIEKSQLAKENVGSNKLIKQAQVRKLPPEKVFIQRQGDKLVKKITCFENWYVINIPEKQEPIVKNTLEMPLITLSNTLKTLKLPSSAWSYKVTLFKLSNPMIGKSGLTTYNGDLTGQSIPEEDREKYQPSCVMFRRMTQQKSKTRMPYDRAVIFKNKTFFTNIDGKNVRLIGAPSNISALDEIEVLLELVDELDLQHEFVETASTV